VGEWEVFVRQDGPVDGLPVTLLHGFPSSSHDWASVLGDLTGAGLRVTTLDFLGFGASDKPARHRYRIEEQAGIVESVWAQLGVGGTALVAHDYGVSVAQELIARDPARFVRTGWLNGGVYPDLHRPIPVQRLLHSPAGKVLSRLTVERAFARTLRSILGRPVPDEVLHELYVAATASRGRRVQWALLRYIDDRKVFAQRWTAALENHQAPALFVWGPRDPVSGAHVLARIRERVARAEVVELAGVGHYPQLEAPAEVGKALSEFLSR
jgi:pimeloyl-ACP methyl ester carboxylesterase